jgi:hypothetical protein
VTEQEPPALFAAGDAAEHGVTVKVLRGSPTPDEIAAVTAVLSAAVVEEAARAEAVSSEQPSAWQRSRRTMRMPLTPGPGQWRSFSA